MKILIIFGIKHSGKTTLAKGLAIKKAYKFFDLDEIIKENDYPSYPSLREGYVKLGKEFFMNCETKQLEILFNKSFKEDDKVVIATGGGICDNLTAIKLVNNNKNIKTVFIRQSEEILLNRIKKNGIPPFLDKNDVYGSFHRLFERREKLYLGFCQYMLYLEDYKNEEQILLALDKL